MVGRLAAAAIVAICVAVLASGRPGLAAARAPASATLVDFEYVGDHRALIAKHDDWRDPALPEERRLAGSGAATSGVGGSPVELPVVSYTWGQPMRARVRVSASDARQPEPARQPEAARQPDTTLVGESPDGWLAMRALGPSHVDEGGNRVFDVVASQPLPRFIAELSGEIRWLLVRGRATVPIARTRHVVLVTAGPPRAAQAWAVTGAGTEPRQPDHNAFTVFRARQVVHIVRGTTTATGAAERIWRTTLYHYDLAADGDVNPWSLLADGVAGQCMTAGAFIEAAFDILGFPGGRVAYVYPSLSRPANPKATVIAHPRIPGAFTVETDAYDVRGQFRTIAGSAAPSTYQHSPAQIEQHRGSHGVERLKMLDGNGHLHNYATAFIVEENGARGYFGGGYSQGPYATADAFLAGACRAVVWAYEVADSDEWESICDAPGGGYVWSTGAPFRAAKVSF